MHNPYKQPTRQQHGISNNPHQQPQQQDFQAHDGMPTNDMPPMQEVVVQNNNPTQNGLSGDNNMYNDLQTRTLVDSIIIGLYLTFNDQPLDLAPDPSQAKDDVYV